MEADDATSLLEPNRLRQLRQERNLSVEEVAIAVKRSAPTVSRYERNEIPIPDPVKAALAELLGVTRAHLMGWDDVATEPAAAAA